MNRTPLASVLIGVLAIAASLLFVAPATATTGGHGHPPICHPVGSATGGNQHDGYSLISPDQASSHIDESLYPSGHYWKHEHGGRHDKYATQLDNGSYTCDDTDTTPPPSDYPYPVTVCWQMTNPDLTSTSTYQFPQTFVAQGSATDTASSLCPASVPGCDKAKYQFDRYTIENDSDAALLTSLEHNGLDAPNGHPQDSALSPHDYSAVIVSGTGTDHNGDAPGCGTPPPPPCTGPCHMPTKDTAAPGVTRCSGIIANKVLNDVLVRAGRDCTLVNVWLNGDLRADRAHNVTLGDTNVKGSIYATHMTGTFTNGATGHTCAADPMVGGSLFAAHSHNVVLCNLSVCKAVNLDDNDGRVMVRKVTAHVIRVQHHDKFVRDPGARHRAMSTLRLRSDHAHRFVIRNNKRPVQRVDLTVT